MFVSTLLALWGIAAACSAQAPGNRTFTLGDQFRHDGNNSATSQSEHGILKRQTQQCRISSYVPCTNILSACCPPGHTCFSDRCCKTGYSPCGSSFCYNPSTMKCCADGSVCALGNDCMGNGFCCPRGQIRCGSSKCYNPATQTCCTGSGFVWACLKSENCCTRDGATACVDPVTEQCCPGGGGTCDKSHTCCGKKCCGSSSICGIDGLCTRKATSSTSKTTGKTTSKTTTSPMQQATPKISTPKPPSSTSTSTITSSTSSLRPIETILFTYDPNRRVKASNGEMVAAPPKAVLANMCDGIANYTGQIQQSITLTKTTDAQREKNRNAMCPERFCADALREYIVRFYPEGLLPEAQVAVLAAQDMQCDEFPFARTEEGGDPKRGSRICLPGTENGWQGGVMSSYFKGRIQVGDKFVVRIVNWNCATQSPDAGMPRQRRDFEQSMQGIGANLYQNYDPQNPDSKLLAMPMGSLDAGSYSINLTVNTGDVDFNLITYDGEQVPTTNRSNGVITFELDASDDTIGLIGKTLDGDVDVSYQAQRVSTVPPAEPTNPAASSGERQRGLPCIAAFMLALLSPLEGLAFLL